jgi:hypothetical protein
MGHIGVRMRGPESLIVSPRGCVCVDAEAKFSFLETCLRESFEVLLKGLNAAR